MSQAKSWGRKIIKALASLRIAVVVILAMGVMSAWGTIVESMYNDAKRAQETVYHSWYSYGIFILLAINLIAVIADRYPWKRRHIGFISAHVGIITLIAGSLLTRYVGIDGSLAFDIREVKNRVLVAETDVAVYSGLPNGAMTKIYEEEVKFIKDPPSEKNPYVLPVGNDKIVIDDFRAYSIPQVKIEASEKETEGAALRFQIANERVSESEWLALEGREFVVKNMGPAQIVLAKKDKYKYVGGNVLLLESTQDSEKLDYKIFTASKPKDIKQGRVKAGDALETGWMGLTFRILKYLHHAKEHWSFEPMERSTEEAIPAIRFKFNGTEYWAGLNSSIRLFSNDAYYLFVYANRQLKLDFGLRLDDFRVGRYQGTRRAASYESDVSVVLPGKLGPRTTISMNEPLKYDGFTFYQSSFKENEMGQPTTSVLSVNRDPGRPWKYLGSILIVFGIIHLFYFKGRKGRA